MKRVFDDDYDIERIIMNINIEARVEVTPGDTLIILDEIQDAPRALESLKYFCENAPEYAVRTPADFAKVYLQFLPVSLCIYAVPNCLKAQ